MKCIGPMAVWRMQVNGVAGYLYAMGQGEGGQSFIGFSRSLWMIASLLH